MYTSLDQDSRAPMLGKGRQRSGGRLLASASILVLALSAGLATTPAPAQTWSGTNGDWFTAGNWTPAAVPTVSDNAEIDPTSYNPTINTGGNANVNNVTVGKAGTAALNILNTGTLGSYLGYIGYQAGSNGQVAVGGTGATWDTGQAVNVGYGGTGALNILSAGKVTGSTSYVGYLAGSSGAVMMDGANSIWINTGGMTVGYGGAGDVTIQNSAKTANSGTSIGDLAGGVGVVTVQTTGSALNSIQLVVGNAGNGTLNILSGGAANTTSSFIADQTGSVGVVKINGATSTWTNSGTLDIGVGGSATLSLLNGGKLSNAIANIGLNAGSSGAVTVGGTGSLWTSAGNLIVGENGTGAVTIQAGGKVTNQQAYLGNATSGHGTVTVTGAGSIWTNTGPIAVGVAGVGTLNILNGGSAADATGIIGYVTNSTGTATVDGASSVWTNSAIVVGYDGSGVLNVSNGGLASATSNVTIARDAGSTGVVNIGGAAGSSALAAGAISGNIDFGAGTGTLNFNHTASLYTLASDITGPGTIHQIAGVTALTGASGGFAGSTIVSGGTLLVNGNGVLAGTTTVQSGGKLGGSGTLTGTTSVLNGGTLLGVQGQTLTLGSLTMASGSRIAATLGAPGGTTLFNLMGNLTLDGQINVTDAGAFGIGVYRLIDYGGTLTDHGLDVGSLPSGTAGTIQTSITHQVNLVVSAAPIQPVPPAPTAAPDIQFWNGATTTANGAVNGGSGSWTAGPLTNWTDTNGTRNDAWGSKFAVFQNNPGSVKVDAAAGAVSVSGLQFIGKGWVVSGDPISLAGADRTTIIRVGDGSAAGASDVATIGAALGGSGRLIKDDLGTLILTGANTYGGGTAIRAGTLQIGDGGTAGSIAGDIANDGVLAFSRKDATTFAATISGSGAVQVRTGAVTLTADNSFTGLTTVNADASLRLGDGGTTGSIGGDLANSGRVEFNRSNDFSFARSISGKGALDQIGAGRTILTGDSSGFAGITTVTRGTLIVNGKLGGTFDLTVGGRLQGSGTIGGGTVAGIIAPGNSIGTLNVNGSIAFTAGSIFEVEANAAGQSDKILASGTATISGGTVQVLAGAGVYNPSTTYTILTAAGGSTGTFASVTSNLAFLDPSLSYDTQNVYLKLIRNDIDFTAVGVTPNQIAAAGAVQSLKTDDAAYLAVLNLSTQQARYAFDQFSGEIHASLKAALIDDGHFVRDAALARLLPGGDSPHIGLWGQGFGSWGRLVSDGNAASINHSVSGMLIGADTMLLGDWRAGAVGGFSESHIHLPARSSSAKSRNYHLGVYGGRQWGDLSLRSGLSYSWHDVRADRSVRIPGFAGAYSSQYDANMAQAFGEIGYGFHPGKATIEPFAGLAHLRLRTDGFTEQGGDAALRGAGGTTAVTLTNLGVRGSAPLPLGAVAARLKGSLGWRHVVDGVDPSRFFMQGGGSFDISGVPLAKDAVVIAPSVEFDILPNATLSASYTGQFGSGSADHALRASLVVKF